MNDYKTDEVQFVDSPALLVYPAIIRENIAAAIRIAGDASILRPHVKTGKMSEIVQMMMDAGIGRFKCATIAEAEMLAATGVKDVLLAYQPSAVKASRLQALMRAFPRTQFACLVDNIESATMLSSLWGTGSLNVYIDLNVGMNRTGVPPEDAFMLFLKMRKLQNLNVAGLHAYDGHVEDRDITVRSRRATAIWEQVMTLKGDIEWKEKKSLQVVLAGSPTFAIYSSLAVNIEDRSVQVSPGTFPLWDAGYRDMLPELPFRFAAVLLARVVSIIDGNLMSIDLGYKAVAAESPLEKRVVFMDVAGAEPVFQSEEHMVLRVPDTSGYKAGDVMYGIPWHVCPTVALYESVYVVQDRHIAGCWKVVARDRKINY